jgi:hypothetical protein
METINLRGLLTVTQRNQLVAMKIPLKDYLVKCVKVYNRLSEEKRLVFLSHNPIFDILCRIMMRMEE